ncbi:hypothetical protein B0H17DRAFT_1140827 [Mycena rosella]|uniref:Uncharacterized protein n=1 Tax=Mycena rosella TaxID=1033263 RepID=A0AAD7D120_MYCRO|nr:hypothetical protein B0H17DRAFT_1140827 [Mycena rosella]
MSSLKRPAEDDAPDTENASSSIPSVPDAPDAKEHAASDAKDHVAAPAPSHLFVVVTDDEYDTGLDSAHEGPRPLGVARTLAGATELMKALHDVHEAKRVLAEGEARSEFGGLDTKSKKGKLVGEAHVGNMKARVEKWKVAEGKTLATGAQFTDADAAAAAPATTVHYAYTIVHSWTDYYGDSGAHALGGVVLKPCAVPALVCAKLPCKGLTGMKFPPLTAKDGVLVAEERHSKSKGKKYLGTARRWVVTDWEVQEAKKAPARKKAKTA